MKRVQIFVPICWALLLTSNCFAQGSDCKDCGLPERQKSLDILVSTSLDRDYLMALLSGCERANERFGISCRMVLRGVPMKEPAGKTYYALPPAEQKAQKAAVMRGFAEVARLHTATGFGVQIDPQVFEADRVEDVPVFVMHDRDGRRILRGSVDFHWAAEYFGLTEGQ